MKNKLDIAVIILTYNEEIHIRRCIKNILPFAKEIFLIDSYSTDETINIAKELGVQILQNKWENNYAKQFNWGLENAPITAKWILRLDADEYLTSELINEINTNINTLTKNITGIIFKRRVYFLGKWIKKGTYPVKLLRLFQYKKGFCEQRLMDEHIQLLEGESIEFTYDFVDYNLNNISWWIIKHNGYAIREAIDLLNIEYNLIDEIPDNSQKGIGKQASVKRNHKYKYIKLPLFIRSFMYFIFRYIFKGGFLEGKEGFLWHFFQGWWYRTLVDTKIFEIETKCDKDRNKIIDFLKDTYHIDCSKL